MASTWSALKIELLETGANSGTWGTATNVNLGDAILGEAITGQATVDFATDADVTITLTDSATTQAARNLRLNITESSTGIGSVRNLILGSGCQIEKFYLINNTGTGAKTVKNTSGTGISVPAGKATLVYNNGTNVVDAASYFSSLTLGSALPVASGGTGQTSYTNGQLLIGNTTGNTLTKATLTAGTGITITNGTGSITIAASGGSAATPTALGTVYGATSSTSPNSTFLGYQAGFTNSTGEYNTFLGGLAGYTSNGGSTAYNTCVGAVSGYSLTTGVSNVFIGGVTPSGNGSGGSITSGSKNTIIGGYGGNVDGLDIRTASNYAVISDGDGNRQITMKEGQTLALDSAVPNAGTGITFPATQSASTDVNTLDDYEEGTWTPTIGGNTTYSGRSGNYVKIGRVVYIDFYIEVNAIGTGSTTIMTGAPFNCSNPSTAAGSTAYQANLATAVVSIGVNFTNGTNLRFDNRTAASDTAAQNATFKSSTAIYGCMTYLTST